MIFHVVSFLGSFLLFLFQPLMGRAVLPLYGGGVGVWLSCMMFFQMMLFLGYLYAHKLISRFDLRNQILVHRSLLILAVLSLGVGLVSKGVPFMPSLHLPGAQSSIPSLAILCVLVWTIAIPTVVLASTSPLSQAWLVSKTQDGHPYRLYVTSNVGSILGLVAFPIVFEPSLNLDVLSWLAAGLFILYVFLMFIIKKTTDAACNLPSETPTSRASIPWRSKLVWAGLSAMGTLWLLSISNVLSQSVASVPLMWMPPLLVYLITFILVFDGRIVRVYNWVGPVIVFVLFVYALHASIPAVVEVIGRYSAQYSTSPFGIWIAKYYGFSRDSSLGVIAIPLVGLFCACTMLNVKVYELRPPPEQLTVFYLYVAVGGAIGGFVGSVLSPLMFSWYMELPLVLLGTCVVVLLTVWKRPGLLRVPLAGGAILACGLAVIFVLEGWLDKTTQRFRDFFGVVMIQQPHPNLKVMTHGHTVHGIQMINAPLRPLSYFGETSGAGILIRTLQKERTSMKIGIVGLGGGSLAAYGRATDEIIFFEISPKIIKLAGRNGTAFTVLKSSPAEVSVQEGDGRQLLEQDGNRGTYDVLVIDAFAGGSIPAHLLTREALQTYISHLKPDGYLVFHITHRLPLYRQVGCGLVNLDMHLVRISSPMTIGRDKAGNHLVIEQSSLYWVAARKPELVFRPELLGAADMLLSLKPWQAVAQPGGLDRLKLGHKAILDVQPWTDQANSLVSLLGMGSVSQ